MKNSFDTSSELEIFRYLNGIKLERPAKTNKNIASTHLGIKTGTLVHHALELPFYVYILNWDSAYQKLNDHMVELIEVDSQANYYGKSTLDYFDRKNAIKHLHDDKNVMMNNQLGIFDDLGIPIKTNKSIECISIKMPVYNPENNIIGLFGCSINLKEHPISESLMHIANMGLLNSNTNTKKSFNIGEMINNVYLTNKEIEILRYTIKGHSAKRIGELVYRSRRTVEFHLENIKLKLNVKSKSELIDKFITKFLETTVD